MSNYKKDCPVFLEPTVQHAKIVLAVFLEPTVQHANIVLAVFLEEFTNYSIGHNMVI
jgi:hypothetical protein